MEKPRKPRRHQNGYQTKSSNHDPALIRRSLDKFQTDGTVKRGDWSRLIDQLLTEYVGGTK